MPGYRDDEPQFGSAEWWQTRHATYVLVATLDILICILFGLFLLIPAALGGFNAAARAVYSALALSLTASVYLIARRRKLTRSGRLWAATAAVAVLAAALSPFVAAMMHLF